MDRRFIPACAGNSAPGPRCASPRPVHPRVCGELAGSSRSAATISGSSPRVRGTRWLYSFFGAMPWFIPACAGNSRTAPTASATAAGSSPRVRGTRARRTSSAARSPVHPRVCGELHQVDFRALYRRGSSPRVRGTLGADHRRAQRHRFIPACAGNSSTRQSARRTPSVHPRVCGELVAGRARRVRQQRFIPACAGNSTTRRAACGSTAVHPRVCGELGGPRVRRLSPSGSSPRVRGTRCRPSSAPRWPRFIPACAGNSSIKPGEVVPLPVHPRVCGELRYCSSLKPCLAGSSPRVRGTRKRGWRKRESASVHPRVCGELANYLAALATAGRFIPACAGNSRTT